jgi:hypothetical protein
VFEEWSTRQQEVRRRWGELGLDKEIQTSVGPYPLQLQVWHLAQEYATHADDIRVRVPVEEREVRDRWRIAFGLFAAEEEGRSVPAELGDSEVRLDLGDRVEAVDLETFIAFLTRRPQHLDDLTRRQAVDRLIHHMDVERAGR